MGANTRSRPKDPHGAGVAWQGRGGPLVFISAAEASADNHGAALIRATRGIESAARFIGVAGPRMVEAGCESIYDMTRHAAMLLGAVANVGRAVRMLSACDRYLRQYPVDAVVVIDSPVLHLPLAAKAHALNIPVLYYIAPQMWAWGMYRIHKLRSNADKVACILPFEEKFFRNQGIDATFVGHPSAERFAGTPVAEDAVKRLKERGTPFVALLPGSRKHVVESLLPGQLEVAQRIKADFPRAAFGVSVANLQVAPIVERLMDKTPLSVMRVDSSPPTHQLPITNYELQRRPTLATREELIRAADLVLVASGTTALEVAFHARPMIVMYQASRLFYHTIGRCMISTKYLSLPNILAGRPIVPEFMPYYTDTAPIATAAIQLLKSDELRRRMIGDLQETVAPLLGARASQRTAEILLSMAKRH